MRSEDSAIGVHLIDDDIFKILKKVDPFGVVRQDSLMQHVRIGHNDMSLFPDDNAGILGRVPVKGKYLNIFIQNRHNVMQFLHLIL